MLIKNIETLLKERRGAIHVGANDGGERDWYIQNGFKPVVWFEPLKEAYLQLSKNLKGVENHYVVNLGVHDEKEHAVLNVADNNGQSSSILPFGTHAIHHPKVHFIRKEVIELIRLDKYLNAYNYTPGTFNFLNIDVQGVELNVLKSLGAIIYEFDYIYTEVNTEELYKGCCLLSDIDAYLEEKGFTRAYIQMTKHNWGDAFYIKNTLL